MGCQMDTFNGSFKVKLAPSDLLRNAKLEVLIDKTNMQWREDSIREEFMQDEAILTCNIPCTEQL